MTEIHLSSYYQTVAAVFQKVSRFATACCRISTRVKKSELTPKQMSSRWRVLHVVVRCRDALCAFIQVLLRVQKPHVDRKLSAIEAIEKK